MQRRISLTVYAVVLLFSGTAAFACGDKLLAIGRGVRFQRNSVAHQANLLIYTAGTQGGAALNSARLQISLKRSVHNMQLVRGGPELEKALRAGGVDVVLVSIADLAGIARQLQSAPSKPIILPVLVQPSRAEFAAARKEYGFALKGAADESEYLTAIDQAMKAKLRTNARS